MPFASNTGANSADAFSGRARNTTSADRAAGSSGTTVPSHIFASDGSLRGALVDCEPVAAVIVTWGWRVIRRISSWPAKPVAPAIATRTGRLVCIDMYLWTFE